MVESPTTRSLRLKSIIGDQHEKTSIKNHKKILASVILALSLGLNPITSLPAEDLSVYLQNLNDNSDLGKSQLARQELLKKSSQATQPKAEARLQIALEQEYIKAISTSKPMTQQLLLREFALMGSDACVDTVATYLNHTDTHLRDQARLTLGHIGSTKALGALLKSLKDMKDKNDILGMVQTLAKFNSKDAIAPLTSYLNNTDPDIVRCSLNSLSKINLPEAYQALMTFKKSAPEAHYQELSLALVNHSSLQFNEAKTIFFDSKAGIARITAFQILCQQPQVDSKLIPTIQAEKDVAVRSACVSALSRDPKYSALMVKDDSQWTDVDYGIMISGMAETHQNDKEDWLLSLLEHKNSAVSLTALQNIGKIGSSKSLDVLMEKMSSRDKTTSTHAKNSLSELMGKNIPQVLSKLYATGDINQKNKVLQALSYCIIPDGSKLCFEMLESKENLKSKTPALQTLCVIGQMDDLKNLLGFIVRSEDPAESKIFSSAAKKIASKFSKDQQLEDLKKEVLNKAESEEKKTILLDIFS
jgi:HEAT repeat protein